MDRGESGSPERTRRRDRAARRRLRPRPPRDSTSRRNTEIDRTYLTQWLVAFALTQAIEVPIYVRFFGVRPLAAFGASAIAHPIFWLIVVPLWARAWLGLELDRGLDDHTASLAYDVGGYLLGESLAFGGEWLYLRRLGVERPFLASCAANGASLTLGLLLQALGLFPS